MIKTEKVLVHLRDDRKLVGVLRSYDQYGELLLPHLALDRPLLTCRPLCVSANLVLTQTVERMFHPPSKSYAQTDRGVFLVRGENVVLLGEVVSCHLPLLTISGPLEF